MQIELSRVEESPHRTSFLPIVLLKILLNITLIAWIPSARAQVSKFEEAGGEISGTVLLESGRPPASQVFVSLRSRFAGIVRSVLTDLEGRFKVQNLPKGTYDIAVEEEGYQAAQTSAQLDGPCAKLVMYMRSRSGPIRQSGYTVSVRELRIPGKARDEFRKGLERVAKNDPSGSLGHFAKATQAFPGYFEAYYNLGLAEMTLGHTNEAMKDFQTSIDVSGGCTPLRLLDTATF
jgi:hypothetical protein